MLHGGEIYTSPELPGFLNMPYTLRCHFAAILRSTNGASACLLPTLTLSRTLTSSAEFLTQTGILTTRH